MQPIVSGRVRRCLGNEGQGSVEVGVVGDGTEGEGGGGGQGGAGSECRL